MFKRNSKKMRGFTLLELLTVVSVVGVTSVMAIPATQNTLEKRRLIDAGEAVFAKLQLVRSEAIKTNSHAYLSFQGSGDNWCLALNETPSCDCNNDGECQLNGTERRMSEVEFPGVSLSQSFAAGATGFEPRRGLAYTTGTATLTSNSGEIRVSVNALGSVSMCSPDGSTKVPGLVSC